MQSHHHHGHAGSSRAETFLSILWDILHEKKWSELVYFSQSGTAIVIPNEGAFVDQVCSQRYNQSSIQAFNKQMNMWGFNRGPRSLKQLAKKGLGGDPSMFDGKNVHRLWIHPTFRRNSSEAERATISRKLDGGGAKKDKPQAGQGGAQSRRRAKKRAEYDDDDEDDEGDDDEEDEEEEDEEDGGAGGVLELALVAGRGGPKLAKPSPRSPPVMLPPLPPSPPQVRHPTFPTSPPAPFIQSDRSPSFPLHSLPPLPPVAPPAKSPARSPRSLDVVMAVLKRAPSASFVTASAQQHKRHKTVSTGAKTIAGGLPAEVTSCEDQSMASSAETDSEDERPPPFQARALRTTYQSSPAPDEGPAKDEPSSARSSTTPKPARMDGALREVASAVALVTQPIAMTNQHGRKTPFGFYFGQTSLSKSPDQPTGRELPPISHPKMLLFEPSGAPVSNFGPSSASRRPGEDLNNAHLRYTRESKPSIVRTDSHASSASDFFVPRTSPDQVQLNLDSLNMLNRHHQDSETESCRSTHEGSTISSQEDSSQSVSRFDPSVRTGQEFKCPVLPIPSPRSRSPGLSPMGQKALALHPHPISVPLPVPAPPHPAMRPHPTKHNSDPMLVDDFTPSQGHSFVYHHPPAPPSQGSSSGETTSAASSSQPFPLPPAFSVTEPAEPTAMAAPPVPRPHRSISDGSTVSGAGAGTDAGMSARKRGKPLKRASGDDMFGGSQGPAPLSRGVSELFPDSFPVMKAHLLASAVFQ